MVSSNYSNNLKGFYAAFDNQKIAYNLKLLTKLLYEYCLTLKDSTTYIIRTDDGKVALEFNGFEILRITPSRIQILTNETHINEELNTLLKISKVENYYFPDSHQLYEIDSDLLSEFGNDLLAISKNTVNYLINFKNKKNNLKQVYQDIDSLNIEEVNQPERTNKEDRVEQTDIPNELTDIEVMELIKKEENEYIEFKGSLLWADKYKENVSINVLIKEVSSFFNTNGGYLIYGISDSNDVIGINNDIKKSNNSVDKLELNIRDYLEFGVGKVAATRIKIEFYSVFDKTILMLTIPASAKPIVSNMYYEACIKHKVPPGPCNICVNQKVNTSTNNSTQAFFVRNGNRVNILNLSESYDYIKMHWPEFNK